MQLDITFPCQYCSNDIIVIESYFYCNGEGLFEHEGVSMKQKMDNQTFWGFANLFEGQSWGAGLFWMALLEGLVWGPGLRVWFEGLVWGAGLTSAFDSEIKRKGKNVLSGYKGAVITRLGYLLVLQYHFLLASCEAYLYTDKGFESLSS